MREHIPGTIWITWSFSCHRNYAQKRLHAVTAASVTRHGWKYHSSQRCSNDHARVSLFIKTEEASPLWGRRASSNFSSSAALAVSHTWKGNTVKYPRPNLPMSWGAALLPLLHTLNLELACAWTAGSVRRVPAAPRLHRRVRSCTLEAVLVRST